MPTRRDLSGFAETGCTEPQRSGGGGIWAEGRGTLWLDRVGGADRSERERNGGSLATPAGRLYAKAAISVAADWRLTVAGAASGAS